MVIDFTNLLTICLISLENELCCLRVIRLEIIMMRNSSYICLCITSHPGTLHAHVFCVRTSASSHLCSSRYTFAQRKEPVTLIFLWPFSNASRWSVLLHGKLISYSTTTVLGFPLHKPYEKCMSPYVSFTKALSLLLPHCTTTISSHNQ